MHVTARFLLVRLVVALIAAVLAPSIAQAQGAASYAALTDTHSAVARPHTAEAAPSMLVGSWTGPLALPGKTLAVGVTISQGANGLAAVLDLPEARIAHHRLVLTQRHDTVQLYDPLTEARYVCLPSPDGRQLAGQWYQVGMRQPLELHRGVPAPPSAAGAAVRAVHATQWESGTLENGQPVGVWQYFRVNPDGQRTLARTYDYTTGRLMYAEEEGNSFEVEVSPGQWEHRTLTQAPWFIGPHDALAAFGAKAQYPAAARRQNIGGKVVVSFVVDTLGRVSAPQVERGLGSGCDEEALRVVQTIPDTWTPGRLGTKAVATRRYMAFAFRMP